MRSISETKTFRIETANLDFVQPTFFNPSGKTVAARRKLTMTDEVCSMLRGRTVSSKSPYVFSSPDKPEKPIGSVRKAHDAAVRRAKIVPGFRLYDLRHTYASRTVMAGVDLPTLSALLGQGSNTRTERRRRRRQSQARQSLANWRCQWNRRAAASRRGRPAGGHDGPQPCPRPTHY
jgi:integrase